MNIFQYLFKYCSVALEKSVVTKALKISLVFGTLLNIINQGDLLYALNFSKLNYAKLILTYLVPYTVTTYTAVSIKLEQRSN